MPDRKAGNTCRDEESPAKNGGAPRQSSETENNGPESATSAPSVSKTGNRDTVGMRKSKNRDRESSDAVALTPPSVPPAESVPWKVHVRKTPSCALRSKKDKKRTTGWRRRGDERKLRKRRDEDSTSGQLTHPDRGRRTFRVPPGRGYFLSD